MSCSALPLAAVGHVDRNREHELFYNFPCENRAAFFCSAPSCVLRSSALPACLGCALSGDGERGEAAARPRPAVVAGGGARPVPGAAAAALQLATWLISCVLWHQEGGQFVSWAAEATAVREAEASGSRGLKATCAAWSFKVSILGPEVSKPQVLKTLKNGSLHVKSAWTLEKKIP